MKILTSFRLSRWATPVTSRPWGILCAIFEALCIVTAYRIPRCGSLKHQLWCRATGQPPQPRQRRRRPLVAALMVAFSVLIFTAGPAGAVGHDTTSNVVLSVPWLTLAISTLIPLLVGYLTASNAPAALKGLLNIAFSAITAAISTLIDNGGTFVAVKVVGAFLASLLASQTAHQVLWKPTGATAAVQANGAKIGGNGLP